MCNENRTCYSEQAVQAEDDTRSQQISTMITEHEHDNNSTCTSACIQKTLTANTKRYRHVRIQGKTLETGI